MELKLGIALFERTTRQVNLTPAGKLLHERCQGMLNAAGEMIGDLQRQFELAPVSLRVGVARSIGLAYLPGYFFAFLRDSPKVQLSVTQQSSREILVALEERKLDAGLITEPAKLPRGLRVTHRFADEFTLILPPKWKLLENVQSASVARLSKALAGQRWLMINRDGFTGRQIYQWLGGQAWKLEPAMELDSFDTIVNLVSLGLGVSLVPRRVLPLYGNRRAIRRISFQPGHRRSLAVVTRQSKDLAAPLRDFVEKVLF
jgi:DNA-binding transcriptional LysR family regulator